MENTSAFQTFQSGSALAISRRVKLSAGTVVYAGASDTHIGVTTGPVAESGKSTGVRLHNGSGSFEMVAAGAITANTTVYAAADGKIAATGTVAIGTANEAATADGDVIEVIPSAAFESLSATLRGSADGLGVISVARATFDATGGKAVGAYGLGVTLPDKAIIVGGFFQVNTAFTSAASTATIALHAQTANDLSTAAAVSGAPYSTTGLKAITPKSNTPESTGIALTAARELTATVAVQALTAGKATLFVHYVIGA